MIRFRLIKKLLVRPLEHFFLRHISKNRWPLRMRIKYACLAYRQATGQSLSINNPILFTEKTIWYKLFYKRQDFSRIVDKYQFKLFIEETLGPGNTIPLLGAWKTVDAFREAWDSLPEEFCLKSNLMSDGNGIMIIHRKSEEDIEKICNFVAFCLKPKNTLINSFCRAYYESTPMVIAEQYMTQIDNQLYDYKIFCFDGTPYCFYVATDHFPGQLSHISFYDMDWKRLDVQYGEHPNCDVEKPLHYDEMLKYANILSQGFPFVRVDFFDTKERLYLAEMTLYPGGGLTLYRPEEFNKNLGDHFHLPVTRN